MADQKQVYNSIVHRYKDLGDGSFAEVVALDGGVTITGPVTVSSEMEIKNDTGNPIPVNAVTRTSLGKQTISVTNSTAVSLTVPSGAVAAVIHADGGALSMTLDASAPTTTSGLRLDDGVMFYAVTELSAVRLIARAGTTSAQIIYFNRA